MNDAALYALAEQAGFSLRWTDYRGIEHAVTPEVLRAALTAMQIPADSAAIAQDSLDCLREQALAEVPGLLVGRCDRPLPVPAALVARLRQHERVHIQCEDGEWCTAAITHSASGDLQLTSLPAPGYHRLLVGDTPVPLAIAPHRAWLPTDATTRTRIWGLSAQLYSLRRQRPESIGSECGVGDFSALVSLSRLAAMRGADALAISPVHALFSADARHFSPYSPSSRLFLNALHIDVASILSDAGLRALTGELQLNDELARLNALPLIDWPGAAQAKFTLLRQLWRQLGMRWVHSDNTLALSFQAFRQRGGQALEDHATFEALHAVQFGNDPALWHWRTWSPALRDPRSAEVAHFAQAHADAVTFHMFLQWLAARGLTAAQRAARDAGMAIGIVADLAVGTDSGGSHVWSRQTDFLMGLQVGAPPDAINTQGQDWGLTTFSPMALRQRGYAPFIDMLRANLQHAGGLRVDHILGLRRLWVLPSGAKATQGVYLAYPQDELLDLIALESQRHRAVIVGEDLGTVPPGFSATLAERGVLGMQVLWFQRDYGFFVEPSRWSPAVLATTTTHDLPSTAGWWRGRDIDWQAQTGQLPEQVSAAQLQQDRAGDREALWAACGFVEVAEGDTPSIDNTQPIVDAAIHFVAKTPSTLAMIPLEDLLGLDEQPNLPGTIDEHPNWRRRLPHAVDALFDDPAVKTRIDRLNRERS